MHPDHDPAENRQTIIRYHQASKHHLDRYAPGPGGLDWANQPDPFRNYAGAEKLGLPLLADGLKTPFSAVRRGELPPPRPIRLDSIAVLLELSLGLSAWKAFGANRWALRCNPSSGNLHPTEGYLVCPDLPGIAGGVYHYLSRDHLLEQRATPQGEAWRAAFPEGGILIGLSSIHWREAWKYGVRAYRYCQHDCGHAIAAIAYSAAALGWRARLLEGWGDAEIAALLGLNRSEDFPYGEPEAPDCLLWVGPAPAAPGPQRLLPALASARWSGRANRLSPARVHWREIDEVARAACLPSKQTREPSGVGTPKLAPAPLPPLRETTGRNIPAATLYRQRRSAVDFDGVTRLPREAWFAMLDALLPRPGVPPISALTWPPRVHLALFVHRVEGVAPGLYALARDAFAAVELKAAFRPQWLWQEVPGCPSHLPLFLLLADDLRDAARLISCHQDIAADSCFSLGFLARFEESLLQGPWNYRHLFWETGLLGQVLYLEAEAAGVRGTGIGCFFDDAMHALLGISSLSFQSLYHFTVGGPVEDPRLTTLPPYAHLRR